MSFVFKVTDRFAAANRALGPISAFNGVDPSRVALVQDIQSRASECESLRAGQELQPHQLSFLQALRSRLEDYCLRDVPAVREWLDAFSEAATARDPKPAYTVTLSGAGGELDRKSGEDIGNLLRELADEGCLSGGDTIRIIDRIERMTQLALLPDEVPPQLPRDWTGCETYQGYTIATRHGLYGVFDHGGQNIAQAQVSRWAARRFIEADRLSRIG